MTLKQAYEYILIELNKVNAPSLLLSDFVYYWNKGTTQYNNLEYNQYNMSQQRSDNLSSLTRTYVADSSLITSAGDSYNNSELHNGTFVLNLPTDYSHLLNCIIEFSPVVAVTGCDSDTGHILIGARRLTEDKAPTIQTNYYFKPSLKSPYYFIHRVSTPTADNGDRNNAPFSTGYRLEIRFGKDYTRYNIENVFIDYLRVPNYLELDQDELDDIDDNSTILEFSDYVCQEIINTVVKLILEQQSNPRLNSNVPVNQTIAPTSK